MRRAFWLVLAGVMLQALVFFVQAVLLGHEITGLLIAHVFYGVLTYYLLMTATVRLWLPALARLTWPVSGCLLLAFVSWLCWHGAREFIPNVQQTNLLELPRLMLRAGYSVFKLGAVTLAGIAAGTWIYRQDGPHRITRGLLLAGGLGTAVCLGLLTEAYGPGMFLRNAAQFTSLPGLALYGFLSMLLIALFMRLTAVWHELGRLAQLPFQGLIVLGGMALPIYAFHQVVRPARDILVLSGVGEGVALAASMGTFLALIGYVGLRIYRIYFN
jgi:hypothetical protein